MIQPVKSIQWGEKRAKAIEIFPKLDSTNQFARSFIKSGGRSGTVIWALNQTDGRGRRGRKWDADESSLTFSLASQRQKQVHVKLTLPGLGLVEALVPFVPDLKLKFPMILIGEKNSRPTETVH